MTTERQLSNNFEKSAALQRAVVYALERFAPRMQFKTRCG
jgi:hypothetical protein